MSNHEKSHIFIFNWTLLTLRIKIFNIDQHLISGPQDKFTFLWRCQNSHKGHNKDKFAELELLVVLLFTWLPFIFPSDQRGYESLFMLSTFINK